MKSAIDYAKLLIKRGLDTNHNTYDGNMKIQKLLFFANFISLIERQKPLFQESVRAFTNGCVVEEVRLRYKNDYQGLYKDSQAYSPDLDQEEYDILNLTEDLFGGLTARELSNLNHTFSFWSNALNRSMQGNGYRDKNLACISPEEMLAEKDKMQSVIERYRANKLERMQFELINGVKFYYASDFSMTDEVISELEQFSLSAEDLAYSVYFEGESLVIY